MEHIKEQKIKMSDLKNFFGIPDFFQVRREGELIIFSSSVKKEAYKLNNEDIGKFLKKSLNHQGQFKIKEVNRYQITCDFIS